MDISTISSISSASTKLMLANVKAKTASSNSDTEASSASAKTGTTTGERTSGEDTAAELTSTTTTSSDSTATKVAELEAKLESGQSLTNEEIKFLNTNSPGSYERILRSMEEKSSYVNSLNSTTSESEAASVHMNKLADMLTEAKSISNDSSLSDSERVEQLKNLSSRVSDIEDLTYQHSLGNTSGTDSASAFKNLLASVSDARQQGVIYKYHPEFAESESEDGSADKAASAHTAATGSSASKTSASVPTGNTSDADTAVSETTSTDSTTSGSAKSASETLAEIHSIIGNQTASSLLTGVKSAGLNLLV